MIVLFTLVAIYYDSRVEIGKYIIQLLIIDYPINFDETLVQDFVSNFEESVLHGQWSQQV